MKIKNTELHIVQGDITQMKVDSIVTSANTELLMHKGLAAAIKSSGGQIIEDEARAQAPGKKGQAIATGAGTLFAKNIIHAIISAADESTDEVSLRDAIRSGFVLAQQKEARSIAFPAIGCTHGGFEPKAAAKILSQEVYKHAFYDTDAFTDIYIVLYDEVMFFLYQQQITSYLDYLQNKIAQGPFITVDIIIELEGGIVLIERSNPPFGWALPGGFLDYGETLEQCAAREAKEETNLDIYDLKQLHTYSDPVRDPRFHTVTTVFTAKAQGLLRAGDDARNARVVKFEEAADMALAFDHGSVIEDYRNFKQRTEAE